MRKRLVKKNQRKRIIRKNHVAVKQKAILRKTRQHGGYGPGKIWNLPKWSKSLRRRTTKPHLDSEETHLPKIVPNAAGEFPWPPEIKKAFAISIRPLRFQALQRRLGPWHKHVTFFPGTNGLKLAHRRPPLSRGQWGCYSSHVRVWQQVRNLKYPALIMEDDASLFYHEQVARRFRHLFDQIKKHQIKWDILYVGHSTEKNVGIGLCKGVAKTIPWDGLFCYMLTPLGAKKLLRRAHPFRCAVDWYVAKEIYLHRLTAIRANPSFGFVVPAKSGST